MRSLIYPTVIFLIIVVILPTVAQDRVYQMNLAKDNISWVWKGGLIYDYQLGLNSRFFINNDFTSNLFRETTQGNKWKDENTVKSGWEYKFNESITAITKIRSHVFSDENSFVEFSKNLLVQEVKYSPVQNLHIIPSLGYAMEDIYSFQDEGWFTQLEVKLNDYNLGGYLTDTKALSSLYFFPGRKNQEHSYYMGFNKQFSDYASDSVRVGYEFIENFYHLAQTADLENVEINSRFLYNQLEYKIFGAPLLTIETKLQNRTVRQENPTLLNHRKELNFFNRFGLDYRTQKVRSGLAFVTSQVTNLSSRTPDMGEETRNDVEGLQSAFNLFLNWKMSQRDEARLSFSFTKYEYTSPDTSKSIDEDDLRFIGDLSYRHRFSRYFTLRFNAHLYLYHQIFIHASRSANNNWNRIFQLSPSFKLTIPGLLEHTNGIKILANYTVYDFEELLPQVRSYIHRKLIYTDSLSIELSDGLSLVTIYELEKEDNGTFYKDIFAQQINRDLTSHFIDVSLVYHRIEGLRLTTGVNWYLRSEWRLVPERRKVRDYYAFSPRLSALYNIGKRFLLHVTVAPKIYRDVNTPKVYYGTGKVNLKYFF